MKYYFLGLAFVLQVCVIGSIFYNAQYPLWYGREFRFQIEPVDPRDLLLGNYAQLRLPIHAFPIPLRESTDDFQPGDNAYVLLEQEGDLWKPINALKHCPEAAQCILGRVRYRYQQRIELTYGLERFYASPERARELETQARNRANTSRPQLITMIAPNGRARIKEIEFK